MYRSTLVYSSTETWATIGAKIILVRQYKNEEFVFHAIPADYRSDADQIHANKINAAASALRALGITEQSMYRLMSKALGMSPRYRLEQC